MQSVLLVLLPRTLALQFVLIVLLEHSAYRVRVIVRIVQQGHFPQTKLRVVPRAMLENSHPLPLPVSVPAVLPEPTLRLPEGLLVRAVRLERSAPISDLSNVLHVLSENLLPLRASLNVVRVDQGHSVHQQELLAV